MIGTGYPTTGQSNITASFKWPDIKVNPIFLSNALGAMLFVGSIISDKNIISLYK